MKVELGLNQPGFTCDDCRWKIERNDCPWGYDYDETNPYAEDCCDFRNISNHGSRFLKEDKRWLPSQNATDAEPLKMLTE